MTWDLPISVQIDGKEYAIRNKCDYRVVLDTIIALCDDELSMEYRVRTALYIFYEDLTGCNDIESAIQEMFKIINYGEQEESAEKKNVKLMDWEHDFKQIVPPISRILGYDVRAQDKYTHWFSFLGGYMEIGDCLFSNIVSIRNKRIKGKKLEKWEQEFYRENKKLIDLPQKFTTEEKEWLDSDW